jgi:hypothetical protein
MITSQGAYLNRVATAAAKLVRQRLLLPDDAERIIGIAAGSEVGSQ